MKLASQLEILAAQTEAELWLQTYTVKRNFSEVEFLAKRVITEYLLNQHKRTMFKV